MEVRVEGGERVPNGEPEAAAAISDATRNAVLVVAGLIATVCFQAGLTPPERVRTGDNAGTYVFLFANSLGFASSTTVIFYQVEGFSYKREIYMALYAMMFTYGFLVGNLMGEASAGKERSILAARYLLVLSALFMPWALRSLPTYWRKIRVSC